MPTELIVRTLCVRYNPLDDRFVISCHAQEHSLQSRPDGESMVPLTEREQRACYTAASHLSRALQQPIEPFASGAACYDYGMFVRDRDRKVITFAQEVRSYLDAFGIDRQVVVGFELAAA